MNRRHFSALVGSAIVVPQARAAGTWRLATGYRAESFHTVNISGFARDVEVFSKGGFRIEVHPNNSLFKLNEIRGAVESGQIESGETIMSSMIRDIPIAAADSVPFVVRSFDDAKRMWRHQRPLIERHFAKRGLVVLFSVPWPPQGLFSSKPIKTPLDLRGTRMRTYNATTARIATLLGAQGVDVPMPEVGKAFAEGRVDNMITSAVTGAENKVWGTVKYFYEVSAWFPKNIVFASASAINALAPSHRDALLKASAAAEARGWEASKGAAAGGMEELRKNGMKVEPIPFELGNELRRLGERFSLEWIRSVGNEANDIFLPYFTRAS